MLFESGPFERLHQHTSTFIDIGHVDIGKQPIAYDGNGGVVQVRVLFEQLLLDLLEVVGFSSFRL